MRSLVASLLLASLLLAGCSGSGSKGGPGDADVIATSKLPDVTTVEGDPSATPSPIEPPREGTRGHIAGYVVSDTVRPIEGAKIRIPGLDEEQVSDRDGSFGFVDLRPGPYFLTVNVTGFYAAEAEVDVEPDQFTRVKFILTPIPPPEPYHTTFPFEGYSDLTDPSVGGFGLGFSGLMCNGCDQQVYFDRLPSTVIVEGAYATSGTSGFLIELDSLGGCCGQLYYGDQTSPFRLEFTQDQLLGAADGLDVSVYPSSLVPETAKSFEFYVTVFYNGGPPKEGWSFLAGDS